MKIMIFTPTYNRVTTLERLYRSLEAQTIRSFKWFVVDDGSTDNTWVKLQEWSEKCHFEMEYIRQENKGKSNAHNKAVKLCDTDLFVCVDSDDWLRGDAVESILRTWENRKKMDVGILAMRAVTKKRRKVKTGIRTTLREAYRKYGIVGDLMLVFRTDIIKRYPFPTFRGETFVPEAYAYDQIDKVGRLIILDETLYFGNYLEDGYTKNMAQILLKNPEGYLAYIKQRVDMDSMFESFIDMSKYIGFCRAVKRLDIQWEKKHSILVRLMQPIGTLFYVIRYRKYEKRGRSYDKR